jgi:hypothetical protein
MPRRLLTAVLLVTAAAGLRCGETRQASDFAETPDSVMAPGSAIAPDFEVVLGSGGGFTGRWTGYRIDGDGTVWSWSGIGVPTDTVRVGRLPADSLLALARALEDASFYADSTAQTGNVTAMLEVTRGGVTHRSSWIPSVRELEPPVSPTEAVYWRAQTMAASAVQ